MSCQNQLKRKLKAEQVANCENMLHSINSVFWHDQSIILKNCLDETIPDEIMSITKAKNNIMLLIIKRKNY